MHQIRRLILSAAILTAAYAQDFRAALTGLVSDPSGAAVAHATVKAIHLDTNAVSETSTNDSGRYSIPFLTPGKYRVEIDAAGFKKVVRENVELQINTRSSLDASLELGGVNEKITVTTQMSLLETETASRGGVVDNKLLQTVPNAGRNINQLAFAMPGVYKPSKSQGNAFTLDDLANSRPSINGSAAGTGGSENNNDILIDGTSDATGGRGVIMIPALESVQEFRVLTNIYDAQYGRTGGGIVSTTTKSGTNEFHGAVFNRRYDNRLNANTFANNRQGVARPDLIQNNYGFQTNGPIFIPKIVDGRNRLFYLLSFDSYPQASQFSAQYSVPLPEMKNGDFSKLFAADGRPVLIYDPLTTVLGANGQYSRTPFAGNRIPADRINPVGQKMASFYPNPTSAGDGPANVNNYYTVSDNNRSLAQWMGRMDYRLSDKNLFFGRYGETELNRCCDRSFPEGSPAETSTILPRGRRGRTLTLDWSSVLSPSMTLNVRAGFSRLENVFGNSQTTAYNPVDLGFPASTVGQFSRPQFPTISAGNYRNMGASPSSTADDTYTLGATAGKVTGTHVMKYGVEARDYRSTNLAFGAASGTYNFTRLWTQNNPNQADALSGNEIASMLLGNPTSGNVIIPITPAYSGRYYALFFQDDWKITRKLTLNLGLRWDYETPVRERYNRQTRGYAFDQASPIAAGAKTAAGVENCPACADLRGGLLYAGDSGDQRYAFSPDRNNVQIRLGAAYMLNNKTVLRGGFGVYSLGQWAMGGSNGYSRTTQMVTTLNNLVPAGSMSNPFPTGVLQPVGNTLGLSTDLGIGTSFNYLNRRLPISKQYSFGIQRDVWAGIVIDASYVGNVTDGLPISASLNYIPADQLNQPASYYTAAVTNPMRGLLPNNAALNGATIPRQSLMTAFPQYSGLTANNVPAGRNRYDALQIAARKRFSNGLNFQVNYMKTKTLEQLTLLNAQDANLANLEQSRLEKRLSIFDVPQKLSILGSYDLPVGRNRAFLSGMNKIANGVFGNWTVGWNFTMQSGFPIDFPNAAPIANRSAKLPSDERTLSRWFDTSVFPNTAQPAFTLRNFPTRFPDVRFMGVHNYDMSLSKEIPIKERIRVQVRADFINSLNRPYFTDLVTNPPNVTAASFGQINPQQNNEPRTIFLEARLTF
ncbi:MAG TPA: TonB-dependent receptor [Bryobacteraceae bacterium]|nr:TonB-dependent receptor [Bryobacteraceae bacterium]